MKSALISPPGTGNAAVRGDLSLHGVGAKSRRPASLGVLTFGALLVLSDATSGQIAGSKHDFTLGGAYGTAPVSQACIFCHVPHSTAGVGPLWNRAPPPRPYRLYQSPTLQARVGPPEGVSLLCLGCHDGAVGIDAFVQGRSGPTQMKAIGDVYFPGSPDGSGGPNLGGLAGGSAATSDLRDDHPVAFVYDEALATANGSLRSPSVIDLPLREGRLACTTCHNPHGEAGIGKFLRKSNTGSQLCLTCHRK